MPSTPLSLLLRLRDQPDPVNWNRFVDLYAPLLFYWASRLRLPPDRIADLVQDVFAILLEQMPRFEYDPQRSFRGWLKTILLNVWRKHLRRQGVERVQQVETLVEVAEETGFSDLHEEEYRAHLVRRALAILQPEFEPTTWKACWEFVVQERPAAEVARELKISVNAVYLAKGRVLRRLRTELQGLFD